VPHLDPPPGRGVEVHVVDANGEYRDRAEARRRVEQLRVYAIRQQAEEAVGLTTCDAEVGRSGGQPPRPNLHVVLTSQARQRVTGNVAGDEAARQEL